MLHKAVKMAFPSEQLETLQVIAAELDPKSDPKLIERYVDIFITSQQPKKPQIYWPMLNDLKNRWLYVVNSKCL